MNWGHQQWYWVPELKGDTLSPGGCALVECFAKAWHRQKSWCESPWETASISEIQRHKPQQVQKIHWAENRQTLGEYQGITHTLSIRFLQWSWVNTKYCLDRPLLLTHSHFYGNFHILCHFQLLLSAAAGCFQQQESELYEIPSFALEDLLWVQEKQGQFVCLRPRGKTLHPSKQTSIYLDC